MNRGVAILGIASLAFSCCLWAQEPSNCNFPAPSAGSPSLSRQDLPSQMMLQLAWDDSRDGIRQCETRERQGDPCSPLVFVAALEGPGVPLYTVVDASNLREANRGPWTVERIGPAAAISGYRLSKKYQDTVYYISLSASEVPPSVNDHRGRLHGRSLEATKNPDRAAVFTLEPVPNHPREVWLREIQTLGYLAYSPRSNGGVLLLPRASVDDERSIRWWLPAGYQNYTPPPPPPTTNTVSFTYRPTVSVAAGQSWSGSQAITLPQFFNIVGLRLTIKGESHGSLSHISGTLTGSNADSRPFQIVTSFNYLRPGGVNPELDPVNVAATPEVIGGLGLASGQSATLSMNVTGGETGARRGNPVLQLDVTYTPPPSPPPPPPAIETGMRFNVVSYNVYALPPEVEGWVGQSERLNAIAARLRKLDGDTPGGVDAVVVTELWSMSIKDALLDVDLTMLAQVPAVAVAYYAPTIPRSLRDLVFAVNSFNPHTSYVQDFARAMSNADSAGRGGWKCVAGPGGRIGSTKGRVQDSGVYIFSKYPFAGTQDQTYGSCKSLVSCLRSQGDNNPFCCTKCANDEDCLAAKGVLWARIAKPTDKAFYPQQLGYPDTKYFNIAATHLQSGATSSANIPETRLQQLQDIHAMIERIKSEHKVYDSEPFLVAGDMNIDGLWVTQPNGPANECPGMLAALNASVPFTLPLMQDATGRNLYYTAGNNNDLRCKTNAAWQLACPNDGECTVATDAQGVQWCSNSPQTNQWLDYIMTLNDFQKPNTGKLQPLLFQNDVNAKPVRSPWNRRDIGYNIYNGWSFEIGDRSSGAIAHARPITNLSDHQPVLGTFRFTVDKGQPQ